MSKLILTTAAAALLAFAPVSAFAQDQSTGGTEMPEAQSADMQKWCEELQAQQGTTGTNEPETTITQEQIAPGSTANGNENSQTTSESADNAEGETLDLQAVTLEDCREGGFLDEQAEQ